LQKRFLAAEVHSKFSKNASPRRRVSSGTKSPEGAFKAQARGDEALQAIPYYCLLAVESLVGVFGLRLYEEPRHTVVDHVGAVEIRQYESRVAAMVEFSGPGEAERSEAFRLLFAYIAGANSRSPDAKDHIAMTAPVDVRNSDRFAMTTPVQTSASRMRFFLPADYDLATAPSPTDSRVKIEAVPAEKLAVFRFTGLAAGASQRQKQLISALAGSKWRPVGEAFMLFYDAPFTLPFLRRNEAAVEVEETS
jgi:hypothetical protein